MVMESLLLQTHDRTCFSITSITWRANCRDKHHNTVSGCSYLKPARYALIVRLYAEVLVCYCYELLSKGRPALRSPQSDISFQQFLMIIIVRKTIPFDHIQLSRFRVRECFVIQQFAPLYKVLHVCMIFIQTLFFTSSCNVKILWALCSPFFTKWKLRLVFKDWSFKVSKTWCHMIMENIFARHISIFLRWCIVWQWPF